MSAQEILDLFEQQDLQVQKQLKNAHQQTIELSIAMAKSLGRGGRIIYVGAGTSGRLGLLDSAEWGPTFGLAEGRIVALLAGGLAAYKGAVEGAEDSTHSRAELLALEFSKRDLLVGISASGAARYVHTALEFAEELTAPRAVVTCNPQIASAYPGIVELLIDTGPELLQGSTRLNAATATHRILQRASLLCAIKMGWVYQGKMVCMRVSNNKLRSRAISMLREFTGQTEAESQQLLEAAQLDIRSAIVMFKQSVNLTVAQQLLLQSEGRLDLVLGCKR